MAVPSVPAKTATLLPSVVDVWLQITLVPALFQTVLPDVVFQLPFQAVMVAPSPDEVSHVSVAALAEVRDPAIVRAAIIASNKREKLRFHDRDRPRREEGFWRGDMTWVVRGFSHR